MYGHSITKEMEAWWAEHGGRHDDPKWQNFLTDFMHLLTTKVDEQRAEHTNDGRFGMSKAGGCTRAAVLKLMDADASALTGSTRVTFWNGHMAEVLGIATLRAIGVPVESSQAVCRIDPYMHSYTDGLIESDERFDNEPMTLTVKSTGYKMSGYNFKSKDWKRYGFAQYPFDGVKKTNRGYWAQAQAEMHALGRSRALLLVVAKDVIKKMEGDPYLGPLGNGSLSFYCEVIERDDYFIYDQFDPTWLRAWNAYENGEIPEGRTLNAKGYYVPLHPSRSAENKANTGTYDPCDYCDLRDACVTSYMASQLSASIEQKQQAMEVANVGI